jgi:hypothetical protein
MSANPAHLIAHVRTACVVRFCFSRH